MKELHCTYCGCKVNEDMLFCTICDSILEEDNIFEIDVDDEIQKILCDDMFNHKIKDYD